MTGAFRTLLFTLALLSSFSQEHYAIANSSDATAAVEEAEEELNAEDTDEFLSCTLLATASNLAFADNSSFPTDPANRNRPIIYKAGKAAKTVATKSTKQRNLKTEAKVPDQRI